MQQTSDVPTEQQFLLPGKSLTETFWLRMMKWCGRIRFLRMKSNIIQCEKLPTAEEIDRCTKAEQEKLELYFMQIEFFQRKFQRCVYEGTINARYKPQSVYLSCLTKIKNHISQERDNL